MRKLPIPAFQAAPEEPILCVFEAQPPPGVSPREVLNPLLPGRQVVRPRVEYYYRRLKALPRRLRRTLQRRYARSLAGVALLLALGQAPALAATINVDGGCTLVDAITAANTDTATSGCPAGSGADVIALTGNVTLSAVNNTTNGPNGLPSVTSPLAINGGGHTLRRSTVTGTPEFRLLHVEDTGNLTLNQITLTNGRAGPPPYYSGGAVYNRGTVGINESIVSGNSASHSGGGFFNSSYGTTLTVTNSTVLGNTGGGLYNLFGTLTLTDSTVSGNTGGGLYNLGTLTLTDSTVSDNTGPGLNNSGTLTLTDSTVSGNSDAGLVNAYNLTLTNSTVSGNHGVGLLNNEGFARVTDSTVSGNDGGGVYNLAGDVTLVHSTVSGNSGLDAGGLLNRSFFDVDEGCYAGHLTLVDSTVSGNSSGAEGGGISVVFPSYSFRPCGTVTLTNSTISGNTADVGGGVYSGGVGGGNVILARTLVAGNISPDRREMVIADGNVIADNFNLFGHDGDAGVVGFTPGPTDIVPNAPLTDILASLADNGGPTQTHALVFGSPAIDASPLDQSCPLTDQRGAFRPQGPACDIGAFEAGVEPDPFVSPTPSAGCTVNGVPGQLCVGTAGPDRILGTAGNDVILGLTGNDHLNGSRGDDRLFGGEDNDRLIGSKGDDQLLGQTGDDDLRGFAGDDVLEGGDGNDRLKGHEGNDQLRGGNGDDALRGLAGQDSLEGGNGSDLLRGGGDADTLNGGPGADRLVGGGGIDRCTSDAEDNIVVLCE